MRSPPVPPGSCRSSSGTLGPTLGNVGNRVLGFEFWECFGGIWASRLRVTSFTISGFGAREVAVYGAEGLN